MSNGRQRIGLALQALGAGFQGRGPEFQAGLAAQSLAESKRRKELSEERSVAAAADARVVNDFLTASRPDLALRRLDNRIQSILQLDGDPSDTQRVRDLVAQGQVQDAQLELDALETGAVARGLIPDRAATTEVQAARKAAALSEAIGRPLSTEENLRIFGAAKRAPLVQIGASGELGARPLTAAESQVLNIPPEEADRFFVNAKGELKKRPETTAETETERATTRRAVTIAPGERLIASFEKAARDAPTVAGIVVDPGARRSLDQMRNALISFVAQNILGTPGAEPGPRLQEQAAQMVPDFSGPLDRSTFAEQMTALRQIMSNLAGGGTTLAPIPEETATTRQELPPPASEAAAAEIAQRFNLSPAQAADVEFTARKKGITPEQVIEMLRERGQL